MTGAKAALRLPALPEFYFYGEKFRPTDYVLIVFDTDKTERTLSVGKAVGVGAITSGINKDDMIPS